jgi:hypothetical protein
MPHSSRTFARSSLNGMSCARAAAGYVWGMLRHGSSRASECECCLVLHSGWRSLADGNAAHPQHRCAGSSTLSRTRGRPALPCNSTRGGREQRLSGATCKKPARGGAACGGAACGEPACARQGRSRLNAEHCGCSAIQPGKATAGSAAVSGAAPSSLLSGPLPFAWFTLTAIVECAKLLGDHQEAVLIES